MHEMPIGLFYPVKHEKLPSPVLKKEFVRQFWKMALQASVLILLFQKSPRGNDDVSIFLNRCWKALLLINLLGVIVF